MRYPMRAVCDESWMQRASCRGMDTELFFPKRGELAHASYPALAVCRDCPVNVECLGYALDNTIMHGIWGGKSERQRAKLRRQRDISTIGRPKPEHPHGTIRRYLDGCKCRACKNSQVEQSLRQRLGRTGS